MQNHRKMILIVQISVGLSLLLPLAADAASKVAQDSRGSWREDFEHQPIATRPMLEVHYTDAERRAFRIQASSYELIGQLARPHLLVDVEGQEWLSIEFQDAEGTIYSTRFSGRPSRINLYRRGPYYCEVHWLDLQAETEKGVKAPVRGDLALFCYPEKILAEITWHGTGNFDAMRLVIKGRQSKEFRCQPFKKGTRQSFAFQLFGETLPLPAASLETRDAKSPLRYDARRGCYVVGTETSSSFQRHFYDHPNRYERATFTITNDATPRKIYVCHESVIGGGIVEGGVLLDQDGHPLPVVVQVSKNFAGEKEEKFYNPKDTPFSETYFPLYLDSHEKVTLTSLHLYQNWGRHMTKHWSSLGAWMDYFHSSTGVTETTCYVPFKFAGIGGVAIADFRAMSQETFWSGQPQHDNLAGHSFLSYYDGEAWQHAKYEKTTYRSTGPNWYDIQLQYTSSDGSIRLIVDIWETPQADELRSFFHARYEVLKPLTVDQAQKNFRFLSVTSSIQRLRFRRFAASGHEDQEIDFSNGPFPIHGLNLPSEDAFLAEFGDHERKRGSNAIVIRRFRGPRDIGPAASLQVGSYLQRFKGDRPEDTRLLLVPNVDRLELQAGDRFEIDGFWLPYGPLDDAATPRREAARYGHDLPRVTDCAKGIVESHLPIRIRAAGNQAEFTIQGGKDLLPVLVTGLTEWRNPRIWKQEQDQWRLLTHARNTSLDGYQVFCEPGGTFGAVFLVASDATAQTLRVSAGEAVEEGDKLVLSAVTGVTGQPQLPALSFGQKDAPGRLSIAYPVVATSARPTVDQSMIWKASEGGSLWFQRDEGGWQRGGRVTPNEDDLDLEYWWQGGLHSEPKFWLDLTGTPFEDPDGQRTWRLTTQGWHSAADGPLESTGEAPVVAVRSADGKRIVCLAWSHADAVRADDGLKIGSVLRSVDPPGGRRYHVRGKIYLMDGSLEILRDRVSKELSLF
jgi:hypothetical protein